MTQDGTKAPVGGDAGHATLPAVSGTEGHARATGDAHATSEHIWWPRLVVGTAILALGVAIAASAKAQSGEGGTGFQVLMIVVSAAVLCLAVLVTRRFASGAPVVRERRGQYGTWVAMVMVGAVAGLGLAGAAIAKTWFKEDLPVLMFVLDLWVLTIAYRFDRAARAAGAAPTALGGAS